MSTSQQRRLTELETKSKKDLGFKVVYRNPQLGSEHPPTSQAEIDALKAQGYTVIIVEYGKIGLTQDVSQNQ